MVTCNTDHKHGIAVFTYGSIGEEISLDTLKNVNIPVSYMARFIARILIRATQDQVTNQVIEHINRIRNIDEHRINLPPTCTE